MTWPDWMVSQYNQWGTCSGHSITGNLNTRKIRSMFNCWMVCYSEHSGNRSGIQMVVGMPNMSDKFVSTGNQLITTWTCANLFNKCSSQFRVLFSLQQHTTRLSIFYLPLLPKTFCLKDEQFFRWQKFMLADFNVDATVVVPFVRNLHNLKRTKYYLYKVKLHFLSNKIMRLAQ